MTDEWTRAEKRKAQSEQAKAIMDFVSMLSDKITELEKENTELKEELEKMTSVANYQQSSNMSRGFKLEQAKSLIKQLVDSSPYKTSSAEYFYKDLIEEAKQFLKEEEE